MEQTRPLASRMATGGAPPRLRERFQAAANVATRRASGFACERPRDEPRERTAHSGAPGAPPPGHGPSARSSASFRFGVRQVEKTHSGPVSRPCAQDTRAMKSSDAPLIGIMV